MIKAKIEKYKNKVVKINDCFIGKLIEVDCDCVKLNLDLYVLTGGYEPLEIDLNMINKIKDVTSQHELFAPEHTFPETFF